MTTRAKAVGQIADSVLVRGVRAGMLAVAAAGLVLVAVVLGLMLVAEAPSRGRTAALLATVGAPGRVHRRLVVSEVLGPVLVGGAAGVLAGAVLPWVVLRLVDLRPFTGASEQPPIAVDPVLLAGAAGGLVLVVALGVGARGGHRTPSVSRRRAQGRSGRMTTMTAPEIRCEDLVRIFTAEGVEVQALQGLNLNVEAGDLVALVGASGSGKSTLLTILSGLDRPTAGSAQVAGHDLVTMSARERQVFRRDTVGFVWQQTARNLLPYLSAVENVELPMVLTHNRRARHKRRERALELLDVLGVGHVADHRPAQLSGGEQQRVAIATAVSNAPTRAAGRRADRRARRGDQRRRARRDPPGHRRAGDDHPDRHPRPRCGGTRAPHDPDPRRPHRHRDAAPHLGRRARPARATSTRSSR